MNSVRMILSIVLVPVMALSLVGCIEPPVIDLEPDGTFVHFVDAYLADGPLLVDLAGQAIGGDLWLHPGDVLIINNTTKEKGTVTFPEGMCEVLSDVDTETKEGMVTITIVSRGRAMLKAIKNMTEDDFFDLGVGSVKALGAPRVQIGDGP
ncbi:MAG: hypothetical protein GY838_07330 [bacterium]|nr:hypothetical protein [bacterium]